MRTESKQNKLKRLIEICVRQELKKINESEKKGQFIIDTDSASDSEKVLNILDSENIKYSKLGPKITIFIDRNSLEASVLLSRLHKTANFEEI